MQPLTKIIDVDGYAHIKRDTDVIATFQNQDDANLFLQAESMVSAADLSIQAGLGLLKEREELIAERDELAVFAERFGKAVREAEEYGFGQDDPHNIEDSWIDELSETYRMLTHWQAKRLHRQAEGMA